MIIYILSFLLSGLVFIGFGVFAWKKQTPVHFWSGTQVKSEEISDVKAYNQANGIMWVTYGVLIILSSIPTIFIDSHIWAVISIIMLFFGLILMMIIYNKIYNKYKA